MDIQKLQISQAKIDINLQFYFFLKYSIKLKPSDIQLEQMLEILNSSALNTVGGKKLSLENIFIAKNPDTFNAKAEIIKEILLKCDRLIDLQLLSIALRLYQIKDLLLQEAKIIKNIKLEKLKTLHPLSLEYDALSILKPYSTRVNGALLSLLFFEKLAPLCKIFGVFLSVTSVSFPVSISNNQT